jgi:hypothetical protein
MSEPPFTPIDPVRFAARLFPRHPSRPFTDWMEPTRPRMGATQRAYCWPNLTRKASWR